MSGHLNSVCFDISTLLSLDGLSIKRCGGSSGPTNRLMETFYSRTESPTPSCGGADHQGWARCFITLALDCEQLN
ncbi:hypothetical protein BSL78_21794 [Apostichopus japonicus]|uniref:Uncharacterized protein n=1 Tax=Stichopus japonicus TaxID=307972 RepID=A0A2G8K043_STIJA|nr:hypothetical protein BSL78_21794 [Apostichopus japonicus]